MYNDKREEGEKIRWNSCQILTKKLKQCWFCFCMFFSTLEVRAFQRALCISRYTLERIQLRGIAFKGDS